MRASDGESEDEGEAEGEERNVLRARTEEWNVVASHEAKMNDEFLTNYH
jgi:hypothetical protein